LEQWEDDDPTKIERQAAALEADPRALVVVVSKFGKRPAGAFSAMELPSRRMAL
jgi:hypothetical protein